MEEHMIALVKSHPHIYDKKNRSYDANVIENIWTEIGEELGKAGYPKLRDKSAANKAWFRIRDGYYQAKKRLLINRSKGDKTAESPWYLFKHLTWLDAHMRHGKHTDKMMPSSAEYDQPAECDQPHSDSYQPHSDSYQPLADSYQPLSEYNQPLSEYNQPHSDSYQPLSEYNQPLSDSYQPLSDSYQPLSDSCQPLSDSVIQLLSCVLESVHKQGYQVAFLASKCDDKYDDDFLSLQSGLKLDVQKQLEISFKQIIKGLAEEPESPGENFYETKHGRIIATGRKQPRMEELMIALVKPQSAIYDKNNRKHYARGGRLDDIWTEIGEELAKAGYPQLRDKDEAKAAWAKLRDSYYQARKRLLTRQSRGHRITNLWYLYDQMTWLDDHMAMSMPKQTIIGKEERMTDRQTQMEELMIALVKPHSALYDKSDRKHNARGGRLDDIWKEIGEELAKAGYPQLRDKDKAKAAWAKLRDGYYQARKRLLKKRSKGHNITQLWYLYNQMTWLDDHMAMSMPKQTISGKEANNEVTLLTETIQCLSTFIKQLLSGVVESIHQQGYKVAFLASKCGDSGNEILSLLGGLSMDVQIQLEVNFKHLLSAEEPELKFCGDSFYDTEPDDSMHTKNESLGSHEDLSSAIAESALHVKREPTDILLTTENYPSDCEDKNKKPSRPDEDTQRSFANNPFVTASSMQDTDVKPDISTDPVIFDGSPGSSTIGDNSQSGAESTTNSSSMVSSYETEDTSVSCYSLTSDKRKLRRTRINIFRCVHCSFLTSKRSILKTHIINDHGKTLPYPCPQCSSSYVVYCDLRLHMLIHSSEKMHHCRYCSYRSTVKRNLKNHVARKHSSISGRSESKDCSHTTTHPVQ